MRAGAERYVHVLEDITFGVCLVKIPCARKEDFCGFAVNEFSCVYWQK